MMTSQKKLRQDSLGLLKKIEDLPTLPNRFLDIQEVMRDCQSSLASITKLIETDQATAVTIMKIANSAHHNPIGKPITSLSTAISRLGRKETADIALSMSLLYGFSMPAGIRVIRQFWAHAFAAGQISRHIVKNSPYRDELDADMLFLASLLHDIGRVVLGIRIDPIYFETPLSQLFGQDLVTAEIEAYGIDHAEIGGIFLQHWGLPREVCDIVSLHHQAPSSRHSAICKLADDMAHLHFQNESSIENIQTKLQGDFLQHIMKDILPKGNATLLTGSSVST